MEFYQRQSSPGAQPPGTAPRGELGSSASLGWQLGVSGGHLGAALQMGECERIGAAGLARKCFSWTGPGGAHFPPGLKWFRWGRSFQSPEPWRQPGRAASRRRPGLPAPKPSRRELVPVATPRSAGLSYAGSGRGGEGGDRAAGPFQNAPSQSCPPRAPAAVVQPKAEAAPRQTGSPVQLWLLVSPVRLSPAAPPPSLETGWSNVSSEALGRPRSPLSPGGRQPQHRGLPPGLGSSSTLRWPEAPLSPSMFPVPLGVCPRPARLAVAFLPGIRQRGTNPCPAQPTNCVGDPLG